MNDKDINFREATAGPFENDHFGKTLVVHTAEHRKKMRKKPLMIVDTAHHGGFRVTLNDQRKSARRTPSVD